MRGMHGMNITIIGAGGTASHLIPPLLKMLEPEDMVHIWDGDSVEDKNLKRQMFEPSEVGMPKASAWETRLGPFRINAHDVYVGEDNIERAIHEYDIVFICADNMRVRQVIDQRAASLDNVTVINGGNEMDSGSVQLHIRRNGVNITPRISYHSPEIARVDPDMATLSCADIALLPGGEQTMLANMTVAALMLQAYRRISVVSTAKQWTKMTFGILTGNWQGSDVRMSGEDWR